MGLGMSVIWFAMFLAGTISFGLSALIIAFFVKKIGKMFTEEKVDKK